MGSSASCEQAPPPPPLQQQQQQESEGRLVFAVRHAESTWNSKAMSALTQTDHGLSVKGIRQALALLSSSKEKEDEAAFLRTKKIYSSPMKRALQTSLLLFEGKVVTLLPLARELRTTVLGRDNVVHSKGGDIYARAVDDLREKGVDISPRPESVDATFADGDWWSSNVESADDIKRRVDEFVQFLRQPSCKDDDDDSIVVVTHSNFLRYLFRAHSWSSSSSDSVVERLGREKVDNCAVLAFRIFDLATEAESKAIIKDARFLFGTGFKSCTQAARVIE